MMMATIVAGTAPAAANDKEKIAGSDKHILGVIPNFGAVNGLEGFEPLTKKEKFAIAYHDSFDWSSFLLAGGYAGLAHLENQNPSFGPGVPGYAQRFGGAFADQAVGNILSEGVFPSLLRQDPRYFELRTGTRRTRALYALTRVFVARTDSGRWTFNKSEWLGNAAAVAISNAYYPETHNVSDNLQRLGVQGATDAFTNVLREFWPDIKRGLFKRHPAESEGNHTGR